MKILFIHRDIGTGSVGKIVEDLYFGLKDAGHQCKIVYGTINKSKIPDTDLYSVINNFDLRLNAFYSYVFDRCGFFGKKATLRVISIIKEFRPDIIHIHGLYGYWLDIRYLYNYLKGKSIIVVNTLHSCWDFTGHCCYFDAIQCNRWQTECFSCPSRHDYPRRFLIDNSKKNYLQKKSLSNDLNNIFFVSPSYWLQSIASKSFLSNHPIFVIPNGIDTSIFRPTPLDRSKYKIPSDKKIVLGVASCWDKRKGINDFMSLRSLLDYEFVIVLVGLNKDQIKKMPKGIIGIAKTENKIDLAGLYSNSFVFFNPTYEDNYPTVNLESISCGTPVITYNTGGSPEAVKRSGLGVVVAKGDIKTTAELIKTSSTLVAPHKVDISYIDSQEMINKYLELYENLLKRIL